MRCEDGEICGVGGYCDACENIPDEIDEHCRYCGAEDKEDCLFPSEGRNGCLEKTSS